MAIFTLTSIYLHITNLNIELWEKLKPKDLLLNKWKYT